MNIKDKKYSIIQKLKKVAIKRDVSFFLIETEFLIERLLARIISDQKLNDSLIFKGGYVGLKVYHSPRYTIDLDALLCKTNLRGTLDQIKTIVLSDIGDCVWFAFEQEVDLKTQGEYGGVRLVFRTGIGEKFRDIKKGQVINFDLGIGDPVTPKAKRIQTSELINGSNLSWQVYPIETIIAEKLHALISRGPNSSRSKDIFDLCQFLPEADSANLKVAIKASFNYRKTILPADMANEIAAIDLELLKRGWTNAVASVNTPPTCEDAFALMIALLRDKL